MGTGTPGIFSTQVSDARYYYLDLDPPETEGIVVVCGGLERCNPDYQINRRTFRFFGIEFVFEGEGDLVLNGEEYHLQPGVVFSYGPEVPCRIKNDPQRPMVKYFVDFVGAEAREELTCSPLGIGQAVQLTNLYEIFDIFEELGREGARSSAFCPEICAQYLRILILKISENVISGAPSSTRALETFQRCKGHIDKNFLTIKSLEEVAGDCHVDLSYLCRLFKRFAQTSPYQYLMKVKMNHAANLLINSGMMVKQVAEELAFSDPYHFSRLFKAFHKVSPSGFLARFSRARSRNPGRSEG